MPEFIKSHIRVFPLKTRLINKVTNMTQHSTGLTRDGIESIIHINAFIFINFYEQLIIHNVELVHVNQFYLYVHIQLVSELGSNMY